MKHLFVSYDTAKALKELGFDELCFKFWNAGYTKEEPILSTFLDESNRSVKAPTHQQVVDWFRDKHNITIYCYNNGNTWNGTLIIKNSRISMYHDLNYYTAFNAAIDEAIKLIKP